MSKKTPGTTGQPPGTTGQPPGTTGHTHGTTGHTHGTTGHAHGTTGHAHGTTGHTHGTTTGHAHGPKPGKAPGKKPAKKPGKAPAAGTGPAADLRRSGQDPRPAGITYLPDSFTACLSVLPEKVDADASEMAAMASELPATDFSPVDDTSNALLPPQQDPILDVLVRNVAQGLSLSAAIDLGVAVKPQDLTELVMQDVSFRGIFLLATRVTDGGMDRRGVEGGFGWFLIDRLLAHLAEEVGRLPRAEREQLLGDFLNPLVLVDKEMRHQQDRKVLLADERARLDQEAQTAEAEAQALLTRQEWKANQPVSRAALLQAARHFAQAQQPQDSRQSPR